MSASQKLDLKTVYSKTYEARNKWSNILLQLNVSHGTIESINTKYRDSPDDCYRAGLSEWLSGGERSWSDMIKALASPTVGHIDLSKLLEKECRGSMAVSEQRVNENLALFAQENIGNGAFGAVFRGSYKGEPCAVKVLHHFVLKMHTNLPLSQDGAFEALERESEFLGMFRHPNVVQHISTERNSQWGNTIILVTELMDCNLRSYLSGLGKKSLTTDGEISLCKDVAAGLAYIHSKQIIHRDLCGDNILLKYDHGSKVPVAKISDFGMSRMINPSTLSTTLSTIPNRKGYLPPEAMEDKYDQSLDVFSLGVIMMQIVQRLESVQSAKERSEHVAQLPTTHKLSPLIKMCLQNDPKRRPSASDANLQQLSALGATDEAPKLTLESCAEFNRYPLKEQECWAVTTIKAPTYDNQPRAPVDIVTVIDKSGSMAGEKLRLVKHTLNFMIDELQETDRLCLITYDHDVYVNFGLLEMNDANKSRAKCEVATICPGSATNLCGGLIKGMQTLSAVEEKAQVQALMLFTDGLANSGFKEKGEILAAVKGYKNEDDTTSTSVASKPSNPFETPPRPPPILQNPPPVMPKRKLQWPFQQKVRWQPDDPQSVPVHSRAQFTGTIYTFGFGSDHDSSLLEAISTQGGGVYYYIDTIEKIAQSLAFCLGGVLSVVGQNLSLKLEIQGGNTVRHIHANRTVIWTSSDKIACDIGMGDIQSEEERDVVLELKLPAVPSPQQDLVLKASLSYFNVITSTMESITFDLVIDRKDGDQGPINETVDVQRNRINALEAMMRAAQLSDQDKPYEARRELHTIMAGIETSPTSRLVHTQNLLEHLQQGAHELMSPCRSHRKNYLQGMHQSYAIQRANDPLHETCSPCRARTLAISVVNSDC